MRAATTTYVLFTQSRRFSFMPALSRLGTVVSMLLLTAACANPGIQKLSTTVQVWDSAARKIISLDELAVRAQAAQLILIGETHDNPVHHQLQNALLRTLSADGMRPALVMEQFDFEQQAAIDIAMSARTSRAAALQILEQEMEQGWEWPQYRALVETAKDRDLPLKAANLSRTRLQQVSRRGFAALGEGEAKRLALDVGWTAAQQAQIEQQIVDGHCGVLPAKAAPAIANAQRARDAMMADALLSVGTGTAVAVLGREHVRRDLSVPVYLTARAPTHKTVVIGLVDADTGQAQVPGSDRFSAMDRRFDYWVLTPAVQRKVDPCEGLVMPSVAPTN